MTKFFLSIFFICLLSSVHSQIKQGGVAHPFWNITGYASCEPINGDSNQVYLNFNRPDFNPDVHGYSEEVWIHGRIPCYDEVSDQYVEESGGLRFESPTNLSFASVELSGLSHNNAPVQHLVWQSFDEGDVIGPSTTFDPDLEMIAHIGYFPHWDWDYTSYGGSNEFEADDRYFGLRLEDDGEFFYGYGSLKLEVQYNGTWEVSFDELYLQVEAGADIFVGETDALVIDNYVSRHPYLVDVNGDDLVDIASSGALLQTDVGVFNETLILDSAFYSPPSLWIRSAVADLDGDGDSDFAGVGFSENIPEEFSAHYTCINDGTGSLTNSISYYDQPGEWLPVDSFFYATNPIITQHGTTNQLHYLITSHWLNCESYFITMQSTHSQPEFTTISSTIPLGCVQPEYDIELFSANLIGGPEEEVYIKGSNSLWVFDPINSTQFNLIFSPDHENSPIYFIETGDFNMDSYTDVLFSNSWPADTALVGTFLALGDGLGSFNTPYKIDSEYSGHQKSADLDLDGDLDFISSGNGWIKVYLNNGSGQFSAQSPYCFNTNGSTDRIAIAPSINGEPPTFAIAYNQDWESQGVPGRIYIPLDQIGCAQDLTNDGVVDVNDFIMFNTAFGTTCSGCTEDLTGDGVVDVNDFLLLNSSFGQACP